MLYFTAHIKGSYKDRVFDDRTVTFNIGEGDECDVIAGVERALKKFTKGEKSILTISPKYAFADKGSEKFDIPADSIVQYEVCLLQFIQVGYAKALHFTVYHICIAYRCVAAEVRLLRMT